MSNSVSKLNFPSIMDRKQQKSNIQFVGSGTAMNPEGRTWKLQNRTKHLKHQQELLNQIHQNRLIKNKKLASKYPKKLRNDSKTKTINNLQKLNSVKEQHQNKYFLDLPNAITSKVKEGLQSKLDFLKDGIECNNRKMDREADQMKLLALKLLKEKTDNQDDVNRLRRRIADSHYKNLIHKENVLGIFSEGCTGLFGNYYKSNMKCEYHCCKKSRLDHSNFCSNGKQIYSTCLKNQSSYSSYRQYNPKLNDL